MEGGGGAPRGPPEAVAQSKVGTSWTMSNNQLLAGMANRGQSAGQITNGTRGRLRGWGGTSRSQPSPTQR
jgi:hypothetical protein